MVLILMKYDFELILKQANVNKHTCVDKVVKGRKTPFCVSVSVVKAETLRMPLSRDIARVKMDMAKHALD